MTYDLADKKVDKDSSKVPDHHDFEKRGCKDRRQRAIPSLKFLFWGGRRKKIRREDDMQKIAIMDSYSQPLFAVIIAILCLSLMDAAMTLYLIGLGAKELNPIMDYFIQKGPAVFITVKYIFTSVAVIIILLIKNTYLPRTQIRTKNLFFFALISFGLVVLWEIYLFFKVVVLAS